MKSLLVRYWNKVFKKMTEPTTATGIRFVYKFIAEKASYSIDNPKIGEERFQNFVFMQCTGKEDKYGKLIYDGDIIREKYIDPDTGEAYQNFRIEKDEKFSCFSQIAIGYEYKEGFPEYDFKEENVEVIGNIWQTPELLKGGECQN